jgi:hypothetical protein
MLENDLKLRFPMLKTKVKILIPLQLLQMTHQNQCPHICIRDIISPMLLVRLSLKDQIILRKILGSPKGTTVTEEGLPLKVENMDFDYVVMIELLRTMVYRKFWTTSYFLG